MQPSFVKKTQLLYYWVTKALFAVLFKQRVQILVQPVPHQQYILIANHQSHADGFMLFTALPWRLATRLLPTAVMGKNRYTSHPVKKFFTGPLGMFPAHRNKYYPAGLEGARVHLERGFSVAIFPEGRIRRDAPVSPHRGAAVLATQTKLPIIPVHFEWNKRRLRRSVTITFGPPFCLLPPHGPTSDLMAASRHLMGLVYAL